MTDMQKGVEHCVVIGGGSWGTAIADALQKAGQHVSLLVRSEDTVALLAQGRCRQLPDLAANAPFTASTDATILRSASMVFVVVPVSATLDALEQIGDFVPAGVPVVMCAKGLVTLPDGETMLMTECAATLEAHPAVIFSGPTFADEVLRGLPAAITAASTHAEAASRVQQAFTGSQLRVYAGTDPIGVAIGGAMKNVIAIAAGCAIGLGLGDNARAALITRGLAEMARLAMAAGAQPDTIYGLSGAGDLALTCAGPHSRNMAFGLALGEGRTPDAKLAEGRHTVAALAKRAKSLGIETPITEGVNRVVNQGDDLKAVVASLLARPAGNEGLG